MLTLPAAHNGFGLSSLMERYTKITARSVASLLNDNGVPGQLGAALLEAQLRAYGNNLANIRASK
jgi:hypothetical protein